MQGRIFFVRCERGFLRMMGMPLSDLQIFVWEEIAYECVNR